MAKNTLTTPEQSVPAQEHSAVVARSGGASARTTLRNIRLIVGREYINRVTQRSYIISTVVLLILVVIGSLLPIVIQYFSAGSSAPTKITYINNAGPIAGFQGNVLTHFIEASLNGTEVQAQGASTVQGSPGASHFVITPASSDVLPGLQNQVRRGSLPVLLVLARGKDQNLQFTYYTAASGTGPSSAFDTTLAQVQTVASQLNTLDKSARLGLTPAQTRSLFTAPGFSVVNTVPKQDIRSPGQQLAGYILAYVGIILIFMSVYLYGMGVALGVAEEKGTRIMEILVNAATPLQLMVGKIIGIGAAGLTQMAMLVAVGIAALLAEAPLKTAILGSNSGGLNIDITGASITLLLLLLVYFILGFLLYATLFAAMGALVRRQDEVQNAVTPITWLFMVGYLASFFGIYNPDATWIKVISLVPFWTPTTMLMRIGTGSAATWEIGLSIVLMLAAIVVCMVISARIYRYGILMYGQKPKLSQIAKMARAK